MYMVRLLLCCHLTSPECCARHSWSLSPTNHSQGPSYEQTLPNAAPKVQRFKPTVAKPKALATQTLGTTPTQRIAISSSVLDYGLTCAGQGDENKSTALHRNREFQELVLIREKYSTGQ